MGTQSSGPGLLAAPTSPFLLKDVLVINVKDHGAKGDGVTNDTVAIQACVDIAAANKGGVIFFPAGEYLISSTILISTSNIYLLGQGADFNHDVGTAVSALNQSSTILKWVGTIGGTVVSFATPTGSTQQRCYGGGLSRVSFNSGTPIAGIGLLVSSWSGGDFERLYFHEFSTQSLLVTCTAGGAAGEPRDCQENKFRDIYARQRNGGGFIKLDGISTANASANYFESCVASAVGMTNVGVFNLANCDSNIFVRCAVSDAAGACDAVVFHAHATGPARDNTFILFSVGPTSSIKMKGTEEAASPTSNNTMLFLDSTNSTPTPTLGTAAKGYWTFTNGASRQKHTQLAVGQDNATADAALAQLTGSATSMALFNNSDDHARIGTSDLSKQWGLGVLGANGDLRFIVLAGTGKLQLASNVQITGLAGFNNATPITKPTVTGAKGGNAALTSLLTALANYGLITDSST